MCGFGEVAFISGAVVVDVAALDMRRHDRSRNRCPRVRGVLVGYIRNLLLTAQVDEIACKSRCGRPNYAYDSGFAVRNVFSGQGIADWRGLGFEGMEMLWKLTLFPNG